MLIRRPLQILAVLPLLLFLAIAQAQTPDQLHPLSAGELGMVKVLLAQERAWNKGDLDSFLATYKNSPDTLFLGTNSVTHGWQEVAERYHKHYATQDTMGVLSFENLQPVLLDDTHGYVTGAFKLERAKKFGGPAAGVFSLILERDAEGWKIILDHTT